MKMLIRTTAAIVLGLPLSPVARAQAPTREETKRATDHAHLVGHEDELLLRRIEDALAEWDPRNLTSPYLKEIQTETGKKYALRRPDLAEFIADPDAAVALGKALFWDMQTGSDFGTQGKDRNGNSHVIGTSCASCHYRHGADARDKNTTAIAYQAWSVFAADRNLQSGGQPPFDQRNRPAPDNENLTRKNWTRHQAGQEHTIVGSQGIILRQFDGFSGLNENFKTVPRGTEGHARRDMFATGGVVDLQGTNRTRQVTQRNSPTVFNSVFYDRQFHDGRAESTFNGFSVFGDYDTRVILKKAILEPQNNATATLKGFHPVSIAIPNASLASQAVGPIVNEVEMSYLGRTFHDLAVKLLPVRPLAAQQSIHPQDSVFSRVPISDTETYRSLIKRAFRAEWWQDDGKTGLSEGESFIPLTLHGPRGEMRSRTESPVADPAPPSPEDRLLMNNFGLYWGLSIMLYESTLVSNETPFDSMLRGNGEHVDKLFRKLVTSGLVTVPDAAKPAQVSPVEPRLKENDTDTLGVDHPDDIIRKSQLDKFTSLNAPPVLTGTAMFQRGFRVFVRNCAECHEPPLFTTAGELELDPEIPDPIAKLHAHALVRTALADAFKERLISTGNHPSGVTDQNRNLLGGRNFFFDAERIPILEELGGPLMIENMAVPGQIPAPLPEQGTRNPMITWFDVNAPPLIPPPASGTRPRLNFNPSNPPLDEDEEEEADPYAFYDVGYYNIGTAPPRYDWGIWAFDESDLSISFDEVLAAARQETASAEEINNQLKAVDLPATSGAARQKLTEDVGRKLRLNALPGINNSALAGEALADLKKQLEATPLARTGRFPKAEIAVSSLGSAYRLPRARPLRQALSPDEQNLRDAGVKELLRRTSEKWRRIQELPDGNEKQLLKSAPIYLVVADHSMDRGFLEPGVRRKDHHFFKRARRMVMTEETWGHRKHFINDNELMGWGAFKTPTLRNVALTEPYMHNGRFLTLRQVLAFYSFDHRDIVPADGVLNPDLHPEIGRLDLNHDGLVFRPNNLPDGPANLAQIQDAEALLFFMHCLTDERVEKEQAPFDHPSIIIPNGYETTPDNEQVIRVEAVGANGHDRGLPQFPSDE